MINFTVSIPTFNGSKRLPFVLDRLRDQQELNEIGWEVIVVDNNSTDETKDVVENYQANFPCVLKYCFESKQGAGFARQLAIREAQGDLIGFLDDDNIPALNWVRAAIDFAREHPQAGAIGSRIHGDYEVEPPKNFERIASFLAITERGNKPHLYAPEMKMLPPSAGLLVRRSSWLENVPEKPYLTGRSTNSILNSEDLEAILYIQNGGWEIWYNPAMEIEHQIPRERLTRDYLLFLMRSTGLARHHIRMLRYKPWQRPFVFFFGWFNDIYKAIQFYVRNHHHLEQDIVKACEMEFLLSTISSPFYLLKLRIKKNPIFHHISKQ